MISDPKISDYVNIPKVHSNVLALINQQNAPFNKETNDIKNVFYFSKKLSSDITGSSQKINVIRNHSFQGIYNSARISYFERNLDLKSLTFKLMPENLKYFVSFY